MVCMGFGSCTVSIFSCPAPALGLGGPKFLSVQCSNPNPNNNICDRGSRGLAGCASVLSICVHKANRTCSQKHSNNVLVSSEFFFVRCRFIVEMRKV